MKINRLFSIAAATMMMVACSSEDTALKNTPAAGPQMQFTATIAAPGSGATTRTEYTEVTTGEAAGTISVAWKENDEIALIHNGVKDVATVKTVNDDGSATITGFITKAENGDGVEVCYPAALWDWDDNTKGAIRNATFVGNITKQDGTLKYIQDNLDVRMAKGELKVDGDKATLNADVKLKSQIAIWKLNLQDNATPTPAALKASQVTVKVDATTPVTIAGTTTLGTATSTAYLAMDAITNENLTIEATVGEATYSCTNEGVTLGAGKYYQSTVTMTKMTAIDLSKLTAAYEAQDGDVLTGTLKENVKISIADGATVTLDGVTINGEDNDSYKWAGITCEGDATIILKGTNTVKGFYEDYPGIYVPGDDENPANNKTLTIKGTGSLTASSSSSGYGAGIGGGYSGVSKINCGNIIIEGGTIAATGGSNAAGIGSGTSGSCGSITISGGTVEATGGFNAAGIGSGYNGTSVVSISISGGTVEATGGDYGAGIGSGMSGSCGAISISGGTVEATGGDNAAGIGSGYDGRCGNITITTGVTQVTARKGNDAINSIGQADVNSSCGTVTIGNKTGTISTTPYTYPEE